VWTGSRSARSGHGLAERARWSWRCRRRYASRHRGAARPGWASSTLDRWVGVGGPVRQWSRRAVMAGARSSIALLALSIRRARIRRVNRVEVPSGGGSMGTSSTGRRSAMTGRCSPGTAAALVAVRGQETPGRVMVAVADDVAAYSVRLPARGFFGTPKETTPARRVGLARPQSHRRTGCVERAPGRPSGSKSDELRKLDPCTHERSPAASSTRTATRITLDGSNDTTSHGAPGVQHRSPGW